MLQVGELGSGAFSMELSSTSEHGGCSGQTLPSFYVFSVTSVRGEGAQESLSVFHRKGVLVWNMGEGDPCSL